MEEIINENEQLDNSNLIFRTIRREIINLQIPPGKQISESEICERFKVSRTPVRTAFQRLSDINLLKIIPYRGIHVSLINFHQLKQMIYMRIAIESKVIRDFIDCYDALIFEKLRYYLRKQEIQVKNACTATEFYNEDAAFHYIWFKTVDKVFLWRKIQHAQVHYTRFRMLDMTGIGDFDAIVKEHNQILSIIENKQKDAVEPFLTDHLNGGIKRLGNKINKEFANYFEPDPAHDK